jgi:hypothetical protein
MRSDAVLHIYHGFVFLLQSLTQSQGRFQPVEDELFDMCN